MSDEQENKGNSIRLQKGKKGFEKNYTDDEKKQQHRRRIHRLNTARYTIFGGLFVIALLVVFHIFSSEHTEIVKEAVRDVISVFATIVTLALGFIAGSNIE